MNTILYYFISQARYLMQGIWNCIQFWTSCMVSLSFLQLLAIALVLPPILSIGLLYLNLFIYYLIINMNIGRLVPIKILRLCERSASDGGILPTHKKTMFSPVALDSRIFDPQKLSYNRYTYIICIFTYKLNFTMNKQFKKNC